MPGKTFWTEPVTVYLIHLDKPYKHARHYIGSTVDMATRIEAHRSGRASANGAALLEAANAAGITWNVVRTWENVNRWFEIKLHRRKNSPKLCPVCIEERNNHK